MWFLKKKLASIWVNRVRKVRKLILSLKAGTPLYTEDILGNLWVKKEKRSHSQAPPPSCGFPVSGNKFPTWVPLGLCSTHVAKDLNGPVTLKGDSNELIRPRCLWAKRSLLIPLSHAFLLGFSHAWKRSPLIFMTFVSFLRYLSSSVCGKHPLAAENNQRRPRSEASA